MAKFTQFSLLILFFLSVASLEAQDLSIEGVLENKILSEELKEGVVVDGFELFSQKYRNSDLAIK
jgi:hypothetical protein